MPLSETGFDRPDLDQLRSDVNDLATQYFGDNVDVSDSAIIGMFMGVIATRDDLLAKLAQAVYDSQFLITSQSADLDKHGADFNIFRNPASSSTVELQIDGAVNTEIPEGTQFSTDNAVLFETIEDAKITELANIVNDEGVSEPLTDDNGDPLGRVTVNAVSVEVGLDNNVGADTITTQFEPIDGVEAVTNPQPATGASDTETDDEYRNRQLSARLNPPSSTEDGIKTYLENNVAGVKQVRVIPNKTMEVDSYGNPPKSTHIYVIGGGDQDVAQGIFNIIAAPANTVGAVVKTVINKSGDPREIKFDRAQAVAIKSKVIITTNDNFNSDSGIEDIKTKMKAYMDTLTLGDDVLFSKFFEYVWQVAGLTSVTVMIGRDSSELSMADVVIGEFELATLAVDDIEVTENV